MIGRHKEVKLQSVFLVKKEIVAILQKNLENKLPN